MTKKIFQDLINDLNTKFTYDSLSKLETKFSELLFQYSTCSSAKIVYFYTLTNILFEIKLLIDSLDPLSVTEHAKMESDLRDHLVNAVSLFHENKIDDAKDTLLANLIVAFLKSKSEIIKSRG